MAVTDKYIFEKLQCKPSHDSLSTNNNNIRDKNATKNNKEYILIITIMVH